MMDEDKSHQLFLQLIVSFQGTCSRQQILSPSLSIFTFLCLSFILSLSFRHSPSFPTQFLLSLFLLQLSHSQARNFIFLEVIYAYVLPLLVSVFKGMQCGSQDSTLKPPGAYLIFAKRSSWGFAMSQIQCRLLF